MLRTPCLRVVQAEETPEQQRPHLGNGRAHGMPVFAEHIPEHDGAGFAFEIRNPEFLGALRDLRIVPACLAHAGEIAFYVRHENRNAARAEIFRECLQRYGLAGAGRSGDKAVAIRHFRQEINWLCALRDKNWVVHKKDGHFA